MIAERQTLAAERVAIGTVLVAVTTKRRAPAAEDGAATRFQGLQTAPRQAVVDRKKEIGQMPPMSARMAGRFVLVG